MLTWSPGKCLGAYLIARTPVEIVDSRSSPWNSMAGRPRCTRRQAEDYSLSLSLSWPQQHRHDTASPCTSAVDLARSQWGVADARAQMAGGNFATFDECTEISNR